MSYQFRGKNATDLPFSENESRAHMERLRELDRRFIAAQEQRESLEPQPMHELPVHAHGKTVQCGTPAGYKTHIIDKTEICTPCREARAIYQRQYRRTRRLIAA